MNILGTVPITGVGTSRCALCHRILGPGGCQTITWEIESEGIISYAYAEIACMVDQLIIGLGGKPVEMRQGALL